MGGHKAGRCNKSLPLCSWRTWRFHPVNVAELARVQLVGAAVSTSAEFLRIQLQTPAPSLGFFITTALFCESPRALRFNPTPLSTWPKKTGALLLHTCDNHPSTLLHPVFEISTFSHQFTPIAPAAVLSQKLGPRHSGQNPSSGGERKAERGKPKAGRGRLVVASALAAGVSVAAAGVVH